MISDLITLCSNDWMIFIERSLAMNVHPGDHDHVHAPTPDRHLPTRLLDERARKGVDPSLESESQIKFNAFKWLLLQLNRLSWSKTIQFYRMKVLMILF